MDWKLEVVTIPVSDMDRAKNFYAEKLGFNVDIDQYVTEDIRFLQLTPPGSACSIHLGPGTEHLKPGALEGLFLVVSTSRPRGTNSVNEARTWARSKFSTRVTIGRPVKGSLSIWLACSS